MFVVLGKRVRKERASQAKEGIMGKIVVTEFISLDGVIVKTVGGGIALLRYKRP